MAYGLTQVLGIGAGLLVIAAGLFVVVARKEGWHSRLFFLLALMDGLSTILFQVSAAVAGPESAFYQALYWYSYIAFVVVLTIFGLLFPLPWRGAAIAGGLVALICAAGLIALLAHAFEHDWFWTAELRGDGSVAYSVQPWGNVVNASFSLAIAVLALKLTGEMLSQASPSHRRQAAFVLGGMTLAYAPYPVGTLARMMSTQPLVLVSGRPDRILAYWAFVAVSVALLASVLVLLRAPRLRGSPERSFLLLTSAAVGVMAVLVWLIPTQAVSRLMRMAALVVYPILLGYAIARYEVFDIDRKLRRAASVTFAAVALTSVFVLAESIVENMLAASVLSGISSTLASGTLAALATAAIFVPVARSSRKAAAKIVPELSHDELHLRKREIYAHSLAGALADGIMKEGESRTLAVLRESLGITDDEHRAILARTRAGIAHTSAGGAPVA